MSRILDVFVGKLYWMLFIVRAIVVRGFSHKFSHSSSSEFLIFWDAFLDALAHPFPTKLKLAQAFLSANLERLHHGFFVFIFDIFAHWMRAPHV